jgi:hypothetical protein
MSAAQASFRSAMAFAEAESFRSDRLRGEMNTCRTEAWRHAAGHRCAGRYRRQSLCSSSRHGDMGIARHGIAQRQGAMGRQFRDQAVGQRLDHIVIVRRLIFGLAGLPPMVMTVRRTDDLRDQLPSRRRKSRCPRICIQARRRLIIDVSSSGRTKPRSIQQVVRRRRC